MKTKILVGILVIGIILTGYFIFKLQGELGEETGGMPVLDAIPVFYSNLTIDSEERALTTLKQNFNEIVENTKEELIKYGKPQEVEIIKEMTFFIDYATIERREWKNDQYWLGPNKSAYVLTTQAVSQFEKWDKRDMKIFVERVKCKGLRPEQGVAVPISVETYEDLKKYFNENCPEGAETYWEETNLKLKYLVDGNGVVYWAGQYLKTKSWLGY
jgi:hypothetical protein